MHPSRLFNLLACPGTNQGLKLVVTEAAGEEPFQGWVETGDGTIVGRLNKFRFEFVMYEPVLQAEKSSYVKNGTKKALVSKPIKTTACDPRIKWVGNYFEIKEYLKGFHGNLTTEYFNFSSTAKHVTIALHSHGWSGGAQVYVDGMLFLELDLFNQETSLLKKVEIDNPDQKPIEIKVQPNGKCGAKALGRQVILEYIEEHFGEFEVPVYTKPSVSNRGGEFRPRFYEILRQLPHDAVILDVGGGKRQLDDKRYINLEYSPYEEPDLLGDAMNLPFRDNVIDFVYSSAVLEHVRNPLKVGEEIFRVLKPGGRVYANSAFMQPVHSEGQHFFNATPYGIDLIFDKFRSRQVSWEIGFADTIRWMVNVVGVNGVVDQEKLDQFFDLADEISKNISYERGMYVASGVWVEAEK